MSSSSHCSMRAQTDTQRAGSLSRSCSSGAYVDAIVTDLSRIAMDIERRHGMLFLNKDCSAGSSLAMDCEEKSSGSPTVYTYSTKNKREVRVCLSNGSLVNYLRKRVQTYVNMVVIPEIQQAKEEMRVAFFEWDKHLAFLDCDVSGSSMWNSAASQTARSDTRVFPAAPHNVRPAESFSRRPHSSAVIAVSVGVSENWANEYSGSHPKERSTCVIHLSTDSAENLFASKL